VTDVLTTRPAAGPSTAVLASTLISTSRTPTLTLLGNRTVVIAQGEPYDMCSGAGQAVACDPGVIATLERMGDATAAVVACADRHAIGQQPRPYVVDGLAACGLNTSVPGTHTITFTLTYGSQLSVAVKRYLVVAQSEGSCLPGQLRCLDGTCEEGVCTADAYSAFSSLAADTNSTSTLLVSTSLRPAPDSQRALAAQAQQAATPNSPPAVTLLTTPSLGRIVEVAAGYDYQVCRRGQVPTPAAPCELGATAADAEDGDLTPFILMCHQPCDGGSGGQGGVLTSDAACSVRAQARLSDHPSMSVCGFDTRQLTLGVSAPGNASLTVQLSAVGAVHRVSFMVFDRHGMASATATRLIKIVSGCSEPAPNFCSGFCSSLPCTSAAVEALAQLRPAAPRNTPPTIQLWLPRDNGVGAASSSSSEKRTFRLQYGVPGQLALAPCPMGAASEVAAPPAGCAATASDEQDGDLTLAIDLTTTCVTPTGAACATRCTAAAVAAGTCPPGIHHFRYTVRDRGGLTASALVEVVVEQLEVRTYEFQVDACSRESAAAAVQQLSAATGTQALQIARHYVPQLIDIRAVGGADAMRGAALVSVAAAPAMVLEGASAGTTARMMYPVSITLAVNLTSLSQGEAVGSLETQLQQLLAAAEDKEGDNVAMGVAMANSALGWQLAPTNTTPTPPPPATGATPLSGGSLQRRLLRQQPRGSGQQARRSIRQLTDLMASAGDLAAVVAQAADWDDQGLYSTAHLAPGPGRALLQQAGGGAAGCDPTSRADRDATRAVVWALALLDANSTCSEWLAALLPL
jgi:hypothetical protein